MIRGLKNVQTGFKKKVAALLEVLSFYFTETTDENYEKFRPMAVQTHNVLFVILSFSK